ncbi:MAG: hypothetical protein MK102_07080 [Fuerstiella sp.]|nr:hypothetical protein [Fuerstiella sp.]
MRSTKVALALTVFTLGGCGGTADNPTGVSVNSTVDGQVAEGMQLVTLRLPGMT